MDDVRISVVTPSYNQGQFLEETIRSVFGQNYPNLEYSILDAGSTDGSIEILRKYEAQLSFWRSVPDEGQSAAINEGFRRANGDWRPGRHPAESTVLGLAERVVAGDALADLGDKVNVQRSPFAVHCLAFFHALACASSSVPLLAYVQIFFLRVLL